MSIGKKIRTSIEGFSFNSKYLPEFIKRAEFLEEKLIEGEELLIKTIIEGCKNSHISLELKKKGREAIKVATFNYSGFIRLYKMDIFEKYQPLARWEW